MPGFHSTISLPGFIQTNKKGKKSLQHTAFLALNLNCKGQGQPAVHTIWLCHIWTQGWYLFPFSLSALDSSNLVRISWSQKIEPSTTLSSLQTSLKYAIMVPMKPGFRAGQLVRELTWGSLSPHGSQLQSQFPTLLSSHRMVDSPFSGAGNNLSRQNTWCLWGSNYCHIKNIHAIWYVTPNYFTSSTCLQF